jgi:hypothetical protein
MNKSTMGISRILLAVAVLFTVVCTGCTPDKQPPRFQSHEGAGLVIRKSLTKNAQSGTKRDEMSIYYLSSVDPNAMIGSGWGSIVFVAPIEFANVGDYIICSNNVIMSYTPE